MELNEVCRRFLGACDRIANSWSIEEGLSTLGQMVTSLIEARSVAIILASHDDGARRIVASRGLSAAFLNRHTFAADDPGLQRVFDGGEDILIGRIDPADPQCAALRLESHDGSLMATPIIAMNRPIGLVIATAAQPDAFDDDHLMVLKLTARLAGACHDRCALYEERRRWMAIDRTTGLWSFEFFCNRMSEDIARSRRQNAPLSVALMDIDGFLRYRQVHGSEAADDLFIRLVEVARTAVRGIDFMGRFGLDEVLIALPQTDLPGAVKAAERIRLAVENGDLPPAPTGITASVGVATLHDDENQPAAMIERAKRAVYAARLQGGNGVSAEPQT